MKVTFSLQSPEPGPITDIRASHTLFTEIKSSFYVGSSNMVLVIVRPTLKEIVTAQLLLT